MAKKVKKAVKKTAKKVVKKVLDKTTIDEKIMENIERVPINEPLVKSVTENGIMNPILCMPNYYPIAGSQRMRALVEVVKTNPEFYEKKINVCRFTKEWWNLYYLWSDKEFRDKAVAIWFQMAELVWKSMYYENDEKFREYERLGDELDWKHKSKSTNKSS